MHIQNVLDYIQKNQRQPEIINIEREKADCSSYGWKWNEKGKYCEIIYE